MCAISGIIRFGGLDTEPTIAARKMAAALKRRGPDDDGYYISPKSEALLVHTRLAVIDPENGAQPMLYADGGRKLALVYNGELYNTAELRALLEARGHKFSTNTDTEAVLRAYAEWGADCLSRMNGIFAFAVWDEAARRLFIARDRIGVKPFYYTLYKGALYFASEIKGLLSCGVPAELDAEGVREIMLLGPAIPCGSGVFKGVFELKPAECAVYDERGLRKHIYWDYGCEGGTSESFDEVKSTSAAWSPMR